MERSLLDVIRTWPLAGQPECCSRGASVRLAASHFPGPGTGAECSLDSQSGKKETMMTICIQLKVKRMSREFNPWADTKLRVSRSTRFQRTTNARRCLFSTFFYPNGHPA